MLKLTARERRHKAVLNKIARLTRARNEGIRAIVAAETQLPKLERQARRNELSVKSRKPKEQPTSPAFERHKGEAATMVAIKPKRQRKPKANYDEALSPDAHIADIRTAEADREKRMEALGFRKIKRKSASPSL
jgi:hypothetical protein